MVRDGSWQVRIDHCVIMDGLNPEWRFVGDVRTNRCEVSLKIRMLRLHKLGRADSSLYNFKYIYREYVIERSKITF